MISGQWGKYTGPEPPDNSWAWNSEKDVLIATIDLEPHAFFEIPVAMTENNADRTLYFYEGGTIEAAGQKVSTGHGMRLNADAPLAIQGGNLYKNLELPFLFGGDGITFLIPGSLAEPLRSILADTRKKVHDLFSLELRVAMIPVSEIYKQGKKLSLGKFAVSDRFSQAILMGTGFETAESMLKSQDRHWLIQDDEPVKQEADFTGFTCRIVQIKNTIIFAYNVTVKPDYHKGSACSSLQIQHMTGLFCLFIVLPILQTGKHSNWLVQHLRTMFYNLQC